MFSKVAVFFLYLFGGIREGGKETGKKTTVLKGHRKRAFGSAGDLIFCFLFFSHGRIYFFVCFSPLSVLVFLIL